MNSRLSPKTEKIILTLATLGALVVLPLYAVKVNMKTDYTDFLVYHRAGFRAIHGGEVFNLADGSSPFRYLPFLLPIFALLAFLPLPTAQLLWYFIQYACFGAGLGFIFKTLRVIDDSRSKWVTALTFFFILRFCLDTFTIGQVSSLMFFGYCLGLYGFVTQRYFLSGSGLFLPTIFKIGPGYSYALFLFSKSSEKLRAWSAPVLWAMALSALTAFCFGYQRLKTWINDWLMIVSKDSQYYDASHYGSQSLKSVLLRFVNLGILSPAQETALLWTACVLGCAGLLVFWRLRKPTDARSRGVFFSLSIFPYLWFMPETFKYSLTVLALPIAFLLLSQRKSSFKTFALIFMFFGVSTAGKDFLPDSVFFGLQKFSIPFIATLFLAWALFREAMDNSRTSAEVPNYALEPWASLPRIDAREFSVITPIAPLQFSEWGESSFSDASPFEVLSATCSELERIYGNAWEWIAVFTPTLDPEEKALLERTKEQITKRIPAEKLKILTSSSSGRSAALREGFLHSSGKSVYLMRWEQPVAPTFLEEAGKLVHGGAFSLVRGNRRLSESRFEIPVKHLRVAYSRHRLGLSFNRLVRLILPAIQTTDTHSGHLVLSRSAAAQIFAVQTSADFLFDLEIALTAKAYCMPETELPVRLYLFDEKSTGRIFAEIMAIVTGLPRLASRYRQGCYRPLKNAQAITADDWGLSPAVNQGILKLAENGTVKRVSLMANCEYLETGLSELRALPGIQLGLHFNLTYGRPLEQTYRPLPPKEFLIRWIFRKRQILPEIRKELIAQLGKLQALKIQPHYFDGHHHIHIVPGLLNEIGDLVKDAGIETVRLPYDPDLKFSGRAPLLIFSKMTQGAMRKYHFKAMTVFYPKLIHFQDHGLLRAKINQNPTAEVIVHPAIRNDIGELKFPDSYTDGRVREYHALQMLCFALNTQAASVAPAPIEGPLS